MDIHLLEKSIIPTSDWSKILPSEVYNYVIKEHQDGIPTAAAYQQGKWYVLQTGQGPYIAKIFTKKTVWQ